MGNENWISVNYETIIAAEHNTNLAITVLGAG
jgi:hypothetical protein